MASKVKSPALRFQTKDGGKIEQTGDAQIPAHVAESKNAVSIPLPKESVVRVVNPSENKPGEIVVTLAKDSHLDSVTNSVAAQGPSAFAPPEPPSQAELAQGWALRGAYALSVVLFLGGGLLLYLQHTKAGLILLAGAAVVPIAANLLTSTVALAIGGACLLVGLTLYAAWHLMQRNMNRQAS